MFMTVKQASEKWGISDRRIRVLCAQGKILGAYHEGRSWKIPVDAKKPVDGRLKSKENLLRQIDRKKMELDSRVHIQLQCHRRKYTYTARNGFSSSWSHN